MADISSQEAKIQSLANILSLLAIAGGMDNAAVQRVLVALGSTMLSAQEDLVIDRELTTKLMSQVASELGEQAALDLMRDLTFIADAWGPVFNTFDVIDAHRTVPYAEVLTLLVHHSGFTLLDHDAFRAFGGTDMVLPMEQITAALKPYAIPNPGLKWEFVGFTEPDDYALVAGDVRTIYLFKTHASAVDLRFSELERNSGEPARSEHDVHIDDALFGAFTAGLIGDMLVWASRLRKHAAPGQEMWKRIQSLLRITSKS